MIRKGTKVTIVNKCDNCNGLTGVVEHCYGQNSKYKIVRLDLNSLITITRLTSELQRR